MDGTPNLTTDALFNKQPTLVMTMKIKLDRSLCIGSSACVIASPEFFALDSDGIAYLVNETPSEELQAKARLAVEECPVAAITIEED
ncbi:ferredoxin [Pseudomonas sp. NCHU5208]|uniref:ferredoxin n=1 Tax=unclassified Pseudomonas TaxID=196821 RepID=UPI003F9B1601